MTLKGIESAAVEAFRSGSSDLAFEGADGDWVRFGIVQLLQAGRVLRAGADAGTGVMRKDDGSPVTALERLVEHRFTAALETFLPEAVVAGEETGGVVPATGWAVAVDPVDGTWGFVSGIETYSTTLGIFKDMEPRVGLVANPRTGEIGYGMAEGTTRLLQLGVFGEDDMGHDLPFPADEPTTPLVNLQPSRSGSHVLDALNDEWRQDRLRMVRSPGGSPAWALLEAARGRYTYVNMWSKRPAKPWDLAAGVILVRGAGGEVADLNGNPIDALVHSGPFVAGVDDAHRAKVIDIVRRVARSQA